PEPVTGAADLRAAWHEALAALGPVDGPDVRGMPDGIAPATKAPAEAAPCASPGSPTTWRTSSTAARPTRSAAAGLARAQRSRTYLLAADADVHPEAGVARKMQSGPLAGVALPVAGSLHEPGGGEPVVDDVGADEPEYEGADPADMPSEGAGSLE